MGLIKEGSQSSDYVLVEPQDHRYEQTIEMMNQHICVLQSQIEHFNAYQNKEIVFPLLIHSSHHDLEQQYWVLGVELEEAKRRLEEKSTSLDQSLQANQILKSKLLADRQNEHVDMVMLLSNWQVKYQQKEQEYSALKEKHNLLNQDYVALQMKHEQMHSSINNVNDWEKEKHL